MSRVLPLLATRDLAAPLAWHRGQPISGERFIGEALMLAEALPAGGRPLNLCQDRYLFALGLAAALLRGQTSLMPPNALPDTLAQVPAGPPPYLLVDLMPPGGAGGLPVVQVRRPAGASPSSSVPDIAADMEAVCL
ncbi:MAG TPA: CoA ligase, partial [Rubrivivax sp.]|nr:CoA ligase [Rubrivivax sp.]